MKKVLFTAVCFAILGLGGLQAQKEGKATTNETEQTPASTARTSKGVSKGSPIIQRRGVTNSAPAGEAAPAKSEQAVPVNGSKNAAEPVAPANSNREDGKATISSKPKSAADSKE